MSLDFADLLAGPRGRRLCLELALTARATETAATESMRTAAFYAAYELDPGRGSSVVLFGPGVDQRSGPPPTPSPAEVARLLDEVPLPACDELTLLFMLRSAVDSARYWQEEDGEDVLAGTPEIRASLARVASAIAATPSATRWTDPSDRHDQWSVDFADTTDSAPVASRSAREVLDEWRVAQIEEETVARRDRPTDPAAMISGTWWSRPPYALRKTTRGIPGYGPAGMWLVEDGFGWQAATIERVRVPADARIYEIDGPAAWAELVGRYPMNVTASRRHDWYRVTGRNGPWAIPNWSRVQKDYDAVHLSVRGYLTTAGVAVPLDAERSTVMAGWDPDATYWLRDLGRDEPTRREWHLDDADRTWKPTPDPI